MRWLLCIPFIFYACSGTTTQQNNTDTILQSQILPDRKYEVISDSTNTLTGKIENLELSYISFGCVCASWITPSDYNLYKNSSLVKHCIFIEPADSSLDLPFYFDPQRYTIKVEGQFYTRKDYPQGTIRTEETLEKAKIFRYIQLELIDHPNQYYSNKIETLVLDYNAIACTCAQWSESKFSNQPDKKELIYLERADDHLINADTLWSGNNLPLQISVKGQFVSLSGFPEGYNPPKGDPKPAMVFRYTSIKVLKK